MCIQRTLWCMARRSSRRGSSLDGAEIAETLRPVAPTLSNAVLEGLVVDPEVAEMEGLVVAAVGRQHRGRAAAPYADLEQVAADVPGLLEVEQASPQGI